MKGRDHGFIFVKTGMCPVIQLERELMGLATGNELACNWLVGAHMHREPWATYMHVCLDYGQGPWLTAHGSRTPGVKHVKHVVGTSMKYVHPPSFTF